MLFSVVTPSFRQFEWLKLNSASVLDQEEVDLEHIIQDAGTGTELESWGKTLPRTRLCVEKDNGMFDAINRGWRKARGSLISQLNCDEQYLPGSLSRVTAFFEANPKVDVAYAASLIMDRVGNLRTYWKAIPLTATGVAAAGISNPTASIFFRRKLLEEGFFFDPRWRCVGDAEWSRSVLAAGKRTATLPFPTSVYAVTGRNLSTTTASAKEIAEWEATSPTWVRLLKFPARVGNAIQRKVFEPSSRHLDSVSYYLPGKPTARHAVRNIVLSTRWPLDLYSDIPPEPHRNA